MAAVLSFLLLPAALVRVLRGGPARPRIGAGHTVVPPGAWTFLPVASTLGLLGGLVAGALSPGRTVWLVAGAYWAVGTAYGAGLRGLARHRYLPFPDSG